MYLFVKNVEYIFMKYKKIINYLLLYTNLNNMQNISKLYTVLANYLHIHYIF